MATKNTSKKKPGKAASRAAKPVTSASSKPPTRKAVTAASKTPTKAATPHGPKRPSKSGSQEASQRATLLTYAFALLSLIFLGAVYYAYT